MVTISTFPLLLKDLARLGLLHRHSGLLSDLRLSNINDLPRDNRDKQGSCPFRAAKNPSNLDASQVVTLDESLLSFSRTLSVSPSGELNDLHRFPFMLLELGDKCVCFFSILCFAGITESTAVLVFVSTLESPTSDGFFSLCSSSLSDDKRILLSEACRGELSERTACFLLFLRLTFLLVLSLSCRVTWRTAPVSTRLTGLFFSYSFGVL